MGGVSLSHSDHEHEDTVHELCLRYLGGTKAELKRRKAEAERQKLQKLDRLL